MFYFSAEASRLLDDVIIKSVIRFGVADNNDVTTIYIDRFQGFPRPSDSRLVIRPASDRNPADRGFDFRNFGKRRNLHFFAVRRFQRHYSAIIAYG